MKNPTIAQPRFTCRLVRASVSIFGDTSAGRPRGPGAAHVAGCEDCRQFFGACDELALALKHDAAREWREAPAALEQNIMRAVNLAAAETAPAARVNRTAWVALAGAAACAVVAVMFFQRQAASGPTIAPPATVAPIATADVSPQQLWNSIKPSADAVLAADPLQNEVDAIASDARSAVRFLALNFMPTAPDRPSRGE